MLSKFPFDINDMNCNNRDKEILRLAMIAELDAVNLYEQLASKAENKYVKEILLDVAREEKTHVGEFQALLIELDPQQGKELEEGKKEVEELKDGK